MTSHLARMLVIAALVVTGPVDFVHGARPVEAQTYVTVIDSERRPVLGLSAEDFSMRDGAVRQPIVDVEPASAPVVVAVVLDGFESGDRPDVVAALDAARHTLAAADPGHRIGLLDGAAAGGPTIVPLPSDRARLDADIVRAGASTGGAAQSLVTRLTEACQALHAAPTDRRVLLAIVKRHAGDGVVAGPAAATLVDAILLNKIAFWTIEAGAAQTTSLDKMLTEGAEMGGALRENVPALSALPDSATRVTSLLVSQYLVTYAWPNPMLSQATISLRHDRGIVLAPIWTR